MEAWVQRYNGPLNRNDWASAMAVDANGNVYVTGGSYDTSASTPDCVTLAYSTAGVPLWTNRYNGPVNNYDAATALALDTSGNVYVTGVSHGGDPVYGGSDSDYLTIKYSSADLPLWTNRYNAPANYADYAKAVAVDASGNVVVTGYSSGVGVPVQWTTVKYSSGGALSWARTYSGASANAVAVDAGGDVYVIGEASAGGYLTIKYSSGGVLLWTNTYSGSRANAVAVAVDGDVVVTGDVAGGYASIKYSSAGVPLWTNRYSVPESGGDGAKALALDAGGNVYVTGGSGGSGGYGDYATIKISSAGVPLWTNRYNGPANYGDYAKAVALDPGGNVFVTGLSAASNHDYDYATIAYSSAGMPLWTNRYNGPGNSHDMTYTLAVDVRGNVYVTGRSRDTDGDDDYTTIKYVTPPIITRQPLSRTNAVGTTATFTVETAGSAPFSYQWRRQGTNLVNGGNVSGVTTTNLLIANVQLADGAGYSVMVSNTYGSVTSTVAQLTVVNPGRFTHLSYSPAMGFSFIFRDAILGRPYRIQRSPSMAEGSWVDWQSFTYSEPSYFLDMGATSQERRFYRAVSP
jgi:hypothetical protein